MPAYNESSTENKIKSIVEQTTQRPILVTWSHIQTESNETDKSNSSEETPATPTNWILIPSVVPVETSTTHTIKHTTDSTEGVVSSFEQSQPTSNFF